MLQWTKKHSKLMDTIVFLCLVSSLYFFYQSNLSGNRDWSLLGFVLLTPKASLDYLENKDKHRFVAGAAMIYQVLIFGWILWKAYTLLV